LNFLPFIVLQSNILNTSIPNKGSLYRSSFTPRCNTKTNDGHISEYSDNSTLCSSSVTRSSTNNSLKRSTFDASLMSKRSTISSAGENNMLNLQSLPSTSAYDQNFVSPLSSHVTSTFPEYEGWIFKQSERYKTWNKRWFVLFGTNLFYFKNPKVMPHYIT
jgi:hypothetical protein